jgi:hypothetical protein
MNITEAESHKIHASFPNLADLLYEGEDDAYTRAFACVFDHWLERDECYKIFPTDPDEIKYRQNKFMKLISHLYEITPIYTARFRRHRKNKLSIKKVKNSEVLSKKCQFHLLNEDYGEKFRFIIPEFSVVYTQSYDWTHLIDYYDNDKGKEFRRIIEEFELHWLE